MNRWWLLLSGPGPPAFNMAMDEALLEASPRLGRPVLRFYGWAEPAATFGFSQKYAPIARLTSLRPLIRRSTGGGLVPHDADWTYSLVIPPAHPWYFLAARASYRQAHEWLQAAWAQLHVATALASAPHRLAPGQCFVGAEQNDLLWHDQKIAGAAQRRTRDGLLVQGSLQPRPDPTAQTQWQQALCDVGRSRFGIEWDALVPDAPLRERAQQLASQKYSQPAYNQRR
jgi:lipoate-protein ligase A